MSRRALEVDRPPTDPLGMDRPRNMIVRLAAGVAALALAVTAYGCRNELQTVVETRERTVVVRYEDGRLVEVLNDLRFELAPGQQVKVVGNCDGVPHVVTTYAAR